MTNGCNESPAWIATIRKNLPDFAKACADETELVLLHQDAFAADYQDDEYARLGMAIKYAGLRGKEVRVIGKSRSTLLVKTTKFSSTRVPLQAVFSLLRQFARL